MCTAYLVKYGSDLLKIEWKTGPSPRVKMIMSRLCEGQGDKLKKELN
jgi:hypothetical protein